MALAAAGGDDQVGPDHFGVRFSNRESHLDLSGISPRWLRDMLRDWMADRLLNDAPRSRNPFEVSRRGCLELSEAAPCSFPQFSEAGVMRR
ncbi:hypothetical protein ACIQ7D_14895 [Streptomyces sp. NPDC096310]|uniref:hypothetical protein n=1 Tax=Streptomyces sp. NPDC096310 TaxID=3366082 RepID=UPI003806C918